MSSMRTTVVRGVRSPLSTRIAAEIRAEMGRRGISSAALARKLGVSEAWTSRRISVKGDQTMDLEDLERIADALEVKIADLFPRDLTLVRARVAERPMPTPTRCAPDVRSSAGRGIHRRPKARGLAGQPIAA